MRRVTTIPLPQVEVRAYRPDDWDAVARVHDAARLQELAPTVGVEAFLTLAQTAESEGLFDGELRVATVGPEVVGFVAYAGGEVTWLYVHPDHQRRGAGRVAIGEAVADKEDGGGAGRCG